MQVGAREHVQTHMGNDFHRMCEAHMCTGKQDTHMSGLFGQKMMQKSRTLKLVVSKAQKPRNSHGLGVTKISRASGHPPFAPEDRCVFAKSGVFYDAFAARRMRPQGGGGRGRS